MSKRELAAQKDVLAALKGKWPFRIRIGVRGKRRPYLVRGKARCYTQVRLNSFYALRQKKLISKVHSVRTHNLFYDEYEYSTPSQRQTRQKRRRVKLRKEI